MTGNLNIIYPVQVSGIPTQTLFLPSQEFLKLNNRTFQEQLNEETELYMILWMVNNDVFLGSIPL